MHRPPITSGVATVSALRVPAHRLSGSVRVSPVVPSASEGGGLAGLKDGERRPVASAFPVSVWTRVGEFTDRDAMAEAMREAAAAFALTTPDKVLGSR
jgi:hypothetical protein